MGQKEGDKVSEKLELNEGHSKVMEILNYNSSLNRLVRKSDLTAKSRKFILSLLGEYAVDASCFGAMEKVLRWASVFERADETARLVDGIEHGIVLARALDSFIASRNFPLVEVSFRAAGAQTRHAHELLQKEFSNAAKQLEKYMRTKPGRPFTTPSRKRIICDIAIMIKEVDWPHLSLRASDIPDQLIGCFTQEDHRLIGPEVKFNIKPMSIFALILSLVGSPLSLSGIKKNYWPRTKKRAKTR